nr:MAG TPA: hypothetical protein [Crassvirales sp.]
MDVGDSYLEKSYSKLRRSLQSSGGSSYLSLL